jgi:ABC-2 type transport system permease protein
MLTLRQLLGRRSTLIPVALCALPVVVAIVFRLSNPDIDAERFVAGTLVVAFVITAALPLSALLLGTSVLGDEFEEGTIVYLLTKPLQRWQILLPKLAAATTVTAGLTVLAILISGAIALQGNGDTAMLAGFAAAVAIAAVSYTSIFVLLSLVTSRALIGGLVYVFIWESAITQLFDGTRFVSVRHFALGLADWFSGVPDRVLTAELAGLTALTLSLITIFVAVVVANRRLQRAEIREAS